MDTNDVSFYETFMLKEIYLSEVLHIKGAVFMKSGIEIVYAPKMELINYTGLY
jgi:hypothetical protein